MIRGRSAILMLITSVLLSADSQGAEMSDTPSHAVHAGFCTLAGSSTGWVASFRLTRRGATLSQFVPWKNRVKSVIEGRVHEVVDECDLGPAIVPDRFSTPAHLASRTGFIQAPTSALLIRPGIFTALAMSFAPAALVSRNWPTRTPVVHDRAGESAVALMRFALTPHHGERDRDPSSLGPEPS